MLEPGTGTGAELAPVVFGERRMFSCHRANLDPGPAPNSLEAVQACVAAGAPRIEIDVHIIRPDLAIVAHDRHLDDGRSLDEVCGELEPADVRVLEDEHARPLVALLEDVVAVTADARTELQVDLKHRGLLGAGVCDGLAGMLAPLGERALVSSEAHWTLRELAEAGVAVGFDPFQHLHWWTGRPERNYRPRTRGYHGFWDDAPIAQRREIDAAGYLRHRLRDVAGLVGGVRELFIEHRTLLAMAEQGVPAGEVLSEQGISLAAWTVPDAGEASTGPVLERLFRLGATTIITDSPRELAGYVAGISRE